MNDLPTVEQLADILQAVCPPDDRFPSREAALETAWEFRTRALDGDPAFVFLIDRLCAFMQGSGASE